MKFVMLLEDSQTVPENFKVLENWGEVLVVDNEGKQLAVGDHMMLEASEHEVKTWGRELGRFWLGRGAPMMQQFERASIAPDVED
jgi:hypothetical protein